MSRSCIRVRDVGPGDGRGCALACSDAGRHLEEIDPAVGQVPAQAGLAEHFESECASPRPPEELCLVAERNAQVVGFVLAVVIPPAQDASVVSRY